MSDQRSVGTAVAPGIGEKNAAAGRTPAAPRQAAPARFGPTSTWRKWLLLAALVVVAGLAYLGWLHFRPPPLPDGFAASNGRLEATEIDIATKIPERLAEVKVKEGDIVAADQPLAQMNIDVLNAELREAQANLREANTAVDTARSNEEQRASEKAANEAVVKQREAELDLASKKYARAQRLFASNSMSKEDFDTDESAYYSAQAALGTAKANVAAASAAISTAKTLSIVAEANIGATQAKIDRLQADIKDCTLRAPCEGRVQFKVAQAGEVLAAGGKVLNLIDLNDVYMTFFLPTDWAGRVKLGAEVRLVLDAAPQFVIPAKVTFVADVAQFTPKTVETHEERQKLTFRIKAHIDPELLKKYVRDVKTGLPGVAYVQLDPQAPWPPYLEVKLPNEQP